MMNINNLPKNIQKITVDEKNRIKLSNDFSEEKFYRFKFGWKMIFPELSDEEIDNLAWCSFMYWGVD